MAHKALKTYTLGTNKNQRRLFLSGALLAVTHFTPGTPFVVDANAATKTVTISKTDMASRKVSHKKDVPVLDINNSTLSEVFPEERRVTVRFDENKITITANHADAALIERLTRLKAKLANNEPLAIGSIASGIGTLDASFCEGLNSEGIKTELSFAIECDEQTLNHNAERNPSWSKTTIPIVSPLEDVDTRDLPKVDIVIAGLPCTGASVSGISKNKLKNPEEHKLAGHLVYPFLETIFKVSPSTVVFENVQGYSRTASMQLIRQTLENWGYTIKETVLYGPDHGALEKRKRLAMIATSWDADIDLDFQSNPAPQTKPKNVGEILEPDNQTDHLYSEMAYLDRKQERDQAIGNGFLNVVVGPEAETVNLLSATYMRRQSTTPKYRHPTDPKLKRLFTPIEHARIKTVPEAFIKDIVPTNAHKYLGQGVIYNAFKNLGVRVAHTLITLRRRNSLPSLPKLTERSYQPTCETLRQSMKPCYRSLGTSLAAALSTIKPTAPSSSPMPPSDDQFALFA